MQNIYTHGGAHSIQYDSRPDECPICRRGIDARLLTAVLDNDDFSMVQNAEIAFQCPRQDCGSMFIGRYLRIGQTSNKFILESVTPLTYKSPDVPDEVKAVSPTFVEIYGQAFAAESHGLHQLTGIGLRKALEFLIKDYCAHHNEDKEGDIRARPLGKIIKEYVSDPRIKSMAERAAWLGNDETHYVRRWEDRDINDLKTLLRLTINWVHNELLTEQYTRDMLEGKKPTI